jgi:hypothetical protein
MLANAAAQNKDYTLATATELFIQQQYTTKEILKKNTTTSSHLSMQINSSDILENTAIIKANFDKNQIIIDGNFDLKQTFNFVEHGFNYSDSSLFTMGFTQPPAALYKLLSNSSKEKISGLLNTNIDSLLLENNHHYSLDITGIYPRIDTAISYTYDADFNPVENKVINNVLEPAFSFTEHGENIMATYNYWANNQKLEQTASGEIFLPMPFVKSYCKKNSEKELSVTSDNYQVVNTNTSVNCILFLNSMADKIPDALKKYFPAPAQDVIKNMSSIQITAKKESKAVVIHAVFTKKKNDLHIIDL